MEDPLNSGPKVTGASQGQMLRGMGRSPHVPGSLSRAGTWEVQRAQLNPHVADAPTAFLRGGAVYPELVPNVAGVGAAGRGSFPGLRGAEGDGGCVGPG